MPLLSGCQIAYLTKSAYSQAGLLWNRIPIEVALKDSRLTADEKRKLTLAQEAREFAEKSLGLRPTKNYTSFVKLDRPYVTYVVSAAEKLSLTPYNWHYPFLGALPYKGYFNPDDAKSEAEGMRTRNFDVYVRGVSAFSTLGWFRDPILSSMLAYRDFQLVNTIIHETVHATIYIKSEADFNERLATFFGNKGAEAFYREKEGPDGPTLAKMAAENHDDQVFSEFIGGELKLLEKWYAERKSNPPTEAERAERFKAIKENFAKNARPRFQSADSYRNFETAELNNARLLTYRLYFEKLDDFESVFEKQGRDFHRMLEFCKSLEKSKDPKADLAAAARS